MQIFIRVNKYEALEPLGFLHYINTASNKIGLKLLAASWGKKEQGIKLVLKISVSYYGGAKLSVY